MNSEIRKEFCCDDDRELTVETPEPDDNRSERQTRIVQGSRTLHTRNLTPLRWLIPWFTSGFT